MILISLVLLLRCQLFHSFQLNTRHAVVFKLLNKFQTRNFFVEIGPRAAEPDADVVKHFGYFSKLVLNTGRSFNASSISKIQVESLRSLISSDVLNIKDSDDMSLMPIPSTYIYANKWIEETVVFLKDSNTFNKLYTTAKLIPKKEGGLLSREYEEVPESTIRRDLIEFKRKTERSVSSMMTLLLTYRIALTQGQGHADDLVFFAKILLERVAVQDRHLALLLLCRAIMNPHFSPLRSTTPYKERYTSVMKELGQRQPSSISRLVFPLLSFALDCHRAVTDRPHRPLAEREERIRDSDKEVCEFILTCEALDEQARSSNGLTGCGLDILWSLRRWMVEQFALFLLGGKNELSFPSIGDVSSPGRAAVVTQGSQRDGEEEKDAQRRNKIQALIAKQKELQGGEGTSRNARAVEGGDEDGVEEDGRHSPWDTTAAAEALSANALNRAKAMVEGSQKGDSDDRSRQPATLPQELRKNTAMMELLFTLKHLPYEDVLVSPVVDLTVSASRGSKTNEDEELFDSLKTKRRGLSTQKTIQDSGKKSPLSPTAKKVASQTFGHFADVGRILSKMVLLARQDAHDGEEFPSEDIDEDEDDDCLWVESGSSLSDSIYDEDSSSASRTKSTRRWRHFGVDGQTESFVTDIRRLMTVISGVQAMALDHPLRQEIITKLSLESTPDDAVLRRLAHAESLRARSRDGYQVEDLFATTTSPSLQSSSQLRGSIDKMNPRAQRSDDADEAGLWGNAKPSRRQRYQAIGRAGQEEDDLWANTKTGKSSVFSQKSTSSSAVKESKNAMALNEAQKLSKDIRESLYLLLADQLQLAQIADNNNSPVDYSETDLFSSKGIGVRVGARTTAAPSSSKRPPAMLSGADLRHHISQSFIEEADNIFRSWRRPHLLLDFLRMHSSSPDVQGLIRRWLLALFGASSETVDDIRFQDPGNERHLSRIPPVIREAWQEGYVMKEVNGLKTRVYLPGYSDAQTLFMLGEDARSCMSIRSRQKQTNRGLLSYLLHGNCRIVGTKDVTGKLLERAIVRLLVDETTGVPVIYVQSPVIEDCDPALEVYDQTAELGDILGLPVVYSHPPPSDAYVMRWFELPACAGINTDSELPCRLLDFSSLSPYVWKDGIRHPISGEFIKNFSPGLYRRRDVMDPYKGFMAMGVRPPDSIEAMTFSEYIREHSKNQRVTRDSNEPVTGEPSSLWSSSVKSSSSLRSYPPSTSRPTNAVRINPNSVQARQADRNRLIDEQRRQRMDAKIRKNNPLQTSSLEVENDNDTR